MHRTPNKAFKSDSQRLAFSSPRWVSCLRCIGLGQVISVAHTLMRRYNLSTSMEEK